MADDAKHRKENASLSTEERKQLAAMKLSTGARVSFATTVALTAFLTGSGFAMLAYYMRDLVTDMDINELNPSNSSWYGNYLTGMINYPLYWIFENVTCNRILTGIAALQGCFLGYSLGIAQSWMSDIWAISLWLKSLGNKQPTLTPGDYIFLAQDTLNAKFTQQYGDRLPSAIIQGVLRDNPKPSAAQIDLIVNHNPHNNPYLQDNQSADAREAAEAKYKKEITEAIELVWQVAVAEKVSEQLNRLDRSLKAHMMQYPRGMVDQAMKAIIGIGFMPAGDFIAAGASYYTGGASAGSAIYAYLAIYSILTAVVNRFAKYPINLFYSMVNICSGAALNAHEPDHPINCCAIRNETSNRETSEEISYYKVRKARFKLSLGSLILVGGLFTTLAGVYNAVVASQHAGASTFELISSVLMAGLSTWWFNSSGAIGKLMGTELGGDIGTIASFLLGDYLLDPSKYAAFSKTGHTNAGNQLSKRLLPPTPEREHTDSIQSNYQETGAGMTDSLLGDADEVIEIGAETNPLAIEQRMQPIYDRGKTALARYVTLFGLAGLHLSGAIPVLFDFMTSADANSTANTSADVEDLQGFFTPLAFTATAAFIFFNTIQQFIDLGGFAASWITNVLKALIDSLEKLFSVFLMASVYTFLSGIASGEVFGVRPPDANDTIYPGSTITTANFHAALQSNYTFTILAFQILQISGVAKGEITNIASAPFRFCQRACGKTRRVNGSRRSSRLSTHRQSGQLSASVTGNTGRPTTFLEEAENQPRNSAEGKDEPEAGATVPSMSSGSKEGKN